MEKSKKKFLKLPHLDGGRELLKAFIKENLVYPDEALKHGIEGDVIIRFKVTGPGDVIDPQVVKGLGHGCDEEALRLVGMLQYQAVKNRGVRVTTNNRIKIPFRLPRKPKAKQVQVTYAPKKKATDTPSAQPQGKTTYGYTIKINRSE
jgi:TonB family protein